MILTLARKLASDKAALLGVAIGLWLKLEVERLKAAPAIPPVMPQVIPVPIYVPQSPYVPQPQPWDRTPFITWCESTGKPKWDDAKLAS